MRHSNSGRKFSRTPSHRKALMQNLAKALLIHGKIRTTEMKAKDLRRVVEPLITLAKRNDLHSRRLAYRVLNDHALVKRLFDEIGPIFAGVPGGYTRILKLAQPRRGDNAPMAIIEFSRAAVADAKAEKSEKAATPKKTTKLKDAGAVSAKPKRAVKAKNSEKSESEAAQKAEKPAKAKKSPSKKTEKSGE